MTASWSTLGSDKLFHLLPAFLRELDGPERRLADDPPGPLQALLRVIEEQADALDADIDQLYQNAFIETCEPWAIPYIGDLVGTTPLFDESRIRGADTVPEVFPDLTSADLRPLIGLGARADVAKTIYYRRRKGTPAMLEELARDVTGWPAHVVEFFQTLQWNQWLRSHVRPHALQTLDLRSVPALDRLGGPFDSSCRMIDVRAIAEHEGWRGVRKLAVFVWRLVAQQLRGLDARRVGVAGDFRWRFSPLGDDAPLFSARRREDEEHALAQRRHVPQALSRPEFFEDMQRAHAQSPPPDFSEYYGASSPQPAATFAEGRAMAVFIDGAMVPLEKIRCANLTLWPQPSDDFVAIDVANGRIALSPSWAAKADTSGVRVDLHHGAPGNLGGGPYRRRPWLIRPPAGTVILDVEKQGALGSFATIAAALAEWVTQGRPDCIVRVRDNRSYEEALAIEPADDRSIAIEAADGCRPHLRLPRPLTISGDHDGATVSLCGLLVEGVIEIAGSLGRLRLIHSTLVPGGGIAEPPDPATPPPPSLTAAALRADGSPANTQLRVEAAFSILGAVRLPTHAEQLILLDCAVDGRGEAAVAGPAADAGGPMLRAERSTLRGAVRVRAVELATDCIFDGLLSSERQQIGCVRFSHVQPGSITPRRYRCQPDLAIRRALEDAAAIGPVTPAAAAAIRAAAAAGVRPEYVSEAYGQPAWLQLDRSAPVEIAEGSEDGAEMGVWCHLKQPQRAANLRMRLSEYLPAGLEAAMIRVN